MENKPIIKFILWVSIIINLCLVVILFTPLTEALYKPLLVNESLGKSQGVVVLSGDSYPNGTPGFLTLTRMNRALEVYRNKWADKIICIGGKRFANNKSIAEVMRELFILYGVPIQDILICDVSTNTYNDIENMLIKFEKEIDFNKTIFVTSSFHTWRVKRILNKKRLEAKVVSAQQYELYPNFWAARFGLFRTIAREYLVICYSKLKGWI